MLDVKRRRSLRVLVNPFGGQGKAKNAWDKVVEPIFRAAGCLIKVDCEYFAKTR